MKILVSKPVMDRLLFSVFAFFPIAAFSQLGVSVTPSGTTCNGGTNGSATALGSGGTGHYSYSWSTGATGSSVSGLPAGTYSVTITDTISAVPTAIFSDDFEGSSAWTLNVVTGTQGADPNFWTISDNEGGVAAGGCGTASNGNNTLHVTSVFNPSGGASYDAGGLCGILYCPQTSSRAESPVFSSVGYQNLTLEFDFISMGQGTTDNASVWYNSGSGWTQLTASIKSTVCGGGQGMWTHYSQALPASCNGASSVQVAINWVNNDDGVGTDPSIAVNDVSVKGQSTSLSLQTATTTFTVSEPPLITGSSSVTACGSYDWNGQQYNASGSYQQTFAASNGCDSIHTLNLVINPLPTPTVTMTDVVTLQSTPADSYQWINCNNGTEIAGATSQVFSPGQNGSYAVIASVNGCSDTSGCVSVTKLGLAENTASVSLYPNPVSDELHVLSSGTLIDAVEIFDAAGKQIYSGVMTGNEKSIDVSTLARGSYIVHLQSGTDVLVMKFIK